MQPLPLEHLPRLERELQNLWQQTAHWTRRRDALSIAVGLCGLRWEEMVRIRRSHIDPNGYLNVQSVKRGLPRCLPIGEKLAAALLHFAQSEAHQKQPNRVTRMTAAKNRGRNGGHELGPTGRDHVFIARTGKGLARTQTYRALDRLTTRLCGHHYSYHSLRHTAAVRTYHATHDVLAVQRLLGHRSLQTTLTYLHAVQTVSGQGLPEFCREPTPKLQLFQPDQQPDRNAVHQCLNHQNATVHSSDAGLTLHITCTVCGRILGQIPCPELRTIQPDGQKSSNSSH